MLIERTVDFSIAVAAVAGRDAGVPGGGDPRPAPGALLSSPGQVRCRLQARSPRSHAHGGESLGVYRGFRLALCPTGDDIIN